MNRIKQMLFVMLLPLFALAHPGIAIVKDSKGNIYYSDLQQVWKLKDGKKVIAVPNVHTHELYIDSNDNLYGQHEFNSNDTTFYHYLWQLGPDGKLDTVVNTQLAYQQVDFSLARDKEGNEYYTKQFLKRRDTVNIYKKTPDGRETIFVKGNFKGVTWLHPQDDGSLLFVQHNTVYRADKNGTVQTVAQNIASSQPSFHFSGNSKTVWGLWEDVAHNIYVAVFSDQAVKKISPDGRVTDYYKSVGDWAPLQGVFDDEGRLWLMESSNKNEIRVVLASQTQTAKAQNNIFASPYVWLLLLVTGALAWLLWQRKRSTFSTNQYRME
jgi:hypothetical protein